MVINVRFLFFDIECSNCFGGVGKMCEFGYVITDENFKVISASDIPMSPGRGRGDRFHLRDRMEQEDVSLAYDEEFYYSQPELPTHYEKIKDLMEKEDTICFAYSASNDIRYLSDSCNKYHLPSFDYTCYDIQIMVANYLGTKGQMGLSNAAHQIVGPNATVALNEHLSRDDAKLAMMVMEAICTIKQINSKTLLEESDSARINSIEFLKQFHANKERKAELDRARVYLLEQAKADEEKYKDGSFGGKRYSFSNKAYSSMQECAELIDTIHSCGGLYVKRFDNADLIIVKDETGIELLKKKISDENSHKLILLSDLRKPKEGGEAS